MLPCHGPQRVNYPALMLLKREWQCHSLRNPYGLKVRNKMGKKKMEMCKSSLVSRTANPLLKAETNLTILHYGLYMNKTKGKEEEQNFAWKKGQKEFVFLAFFSII